MNNEVLLPAVLGITIGLLLVVAAAFRSAKAPSGGVLSRAATTGLLVYAVVTVPFFARGGLTLPWLLVMLAVLGLVLVAAAKGAVASVPGWIRALVAVGLAAVMLVSAGQTLALLTRVDPRMVVVVLTVVTGLIVGLQGLAAAGRVASTTVWILLVPIVISLALGFLLGGFGEVVTPIVPVAGPSVMVIAALTVSVLTIAWADPGLGSLIERLAQRWVARVAIPALAIVVLMALGQLMFLGGSILAPSMQFFVVPSNIDILPALAAVLLAISTMVFAGLISAPLAGLHSLGGGRWVAGGAVAAALLALLNPGAEQILVATGMVGAAALGATFGSGDQNRACAIGVAAAVIAVVAMVALDQWHMGLPSVVATVVIAAVSAITGRVKSTPTPVA